MPAPTGVERGEDETGCAGACEEVGEQARAEVESAGTGVLGGGGISGGSGPSQPAQAAAMAPAGLLMMEVATVCQNRLLVVGHPLPLRSVSCLHSL